MQHLSTAFLIIVLAIAVNQDAVRAALVETYDSLDQVAEEAKNRAVTVIDGPKLVAPPQTPQKEVDTTQKPDARPPSKPPITPVPILGKPTYVDLPRLYYGQLQNLPPLRQPYNKPLKIHPPNSVFKYHKVIPLQPVRVPLIKKHPQPAQQLVFAASTSKSTIAKPPKFSLPVETVNGIRSEVVRPPHFFNTSSTTTLPSTTTKKYLRTKRIWPKRIVEKKSPVANGTATANKTIDDLNPAASHHVIHVYTNDNDVSSGPTTRRPYRRVTRIPKKKPTTPAPENFTLFETNDWVPIVPSHYTVQKVRKIKQTPINRRSDDFFYDIDETPGQNHNNKKRMIYLHSFGLVPMANSINPSVMGRKNIVYVGKKKTLKPPSSGYRKRPVRKPRVIKYDLSEPNIITRIKHHHHHHHHRYVKTIEKPVRVEVPKPVPVPVPMPVPVKIETKVPYPVPIKVPHPVPVKVVEKEYVPKPYPVIQHVPFLKHVEVKVPQPVPVPYEKKVPYPVEVKVPVDKPVPVTVTVEKKVPFPVPVKIFVPQPYPVETKVPYPVHVTEPVEVIKHVAVRVPVPQPYPVQVPVKVPYPVEKKVPYPVEVEKKVPVPVPFRIHVPEKVEVEKKVPIYIPKPITIEKKVPIPVKVPYPVKVPIKVPVGVPILVHPSPFSSEHVVTGDVSVDDGTGGSHYAYSLHGNSASNSVHGVTDIPQQSVTVHGNGVTHNPRHTVTVHGNLFNGFQSRSDYVEVSTPANSYLEPVTTSELEPSSESVGVESLTTTVNETPESEPRSNDVTTAILDPR